eukprot:GHVQ01015164.1.p1 GENE.GHVQ01015164.1~~GHVQ01015164.1.p1  ORF type:complete len:491 (-),score=78.42 GHVQ01015164.1:288-1760(-)
MADHGAGRGRGRQAILPAWMTQGVSKPGGPPPVSPGPPPSAGIGKGMTPSMVDDKASHDMKPNSMIRKRSRDTDDPSDVPRGKFENMRRRSATPPPSRSVSPVQKRVRRRQRSSSSSRSPSPSSSVYRSPYRRSSRSVPRPCPRRRPGSRSPPSRRPPSLSPPRRPIRYRSSPPSTSPPSQRRPRAAPVRSRSNPRRPVFKSPPPSRGRRYSVSVSRSTSSDSRSRSPSPVAAPPHRRKNPPPRYTRRSRSSSSYRSESSRTSPPPRPRNRKQPSPLPEARPGRRGSKGYSRGNAVSADLNGRGGEKAAKRKSRSIDSVSPSPPPVTAAILCDRLLNIRKIPWRDRPAHLDEFNAFFDSSPDFCAEDRDGTKLPFKKLQKRFFTDGPDKVQVTKRLFLEASSTHSFCLDYELYEDSDQVVLYECRGGKITRVYLFRDKDDHISPSKAATLDEIKASSVYRQVFKYLCKKGVKPDATHHYYDYENKPDVIE